MIRFMAHRGFSKKYPENTIEAFRAVIEHPQNGKNLIGIELDIHLTKDERIPVLHDTVLNDASGKTFPVCDITFEDLQEIHARSRPGKGPVPDIDQILKLIDHQTELCFEIKEGRYDPARFTDLLVMRLEEYRPRGDVTLSSFSHEILRYVNRHVSGLDIRYGFIFKTWEALGSLPSEVDAFLDYIHPRFNLLVDTPEKIPNNGHLIQCWTVDDPLVVRRIAGLPQHDSIRTIMTNDIELATQCSTGDVI